MEHGDVIDIDDLLGDGPPQQPSLSVEEYNLDKFLDPAHDDPASNRSEERQLGEALMCGYESRSSSKTDRPFATEVKSADYRTDISNEALLDTLLSSVGQAVLHGSDEDPMDINSEELHRFICEFQEESGGGAISGPGEGRAPEDGVSVGSSASESHDDRCAQGDSAHLTKRKHNNKMLRGVRLLLANLLRTKSVSLASNAIPNQDRQKESHRQKAKEKSKCREEKTSTGDRHASDSSVPCAQSPLVLTHSPQKENGFTRRDEQRSGLPMSEAHTPGMNQETMEAFRGVLDGDLSTLEYYLKKNPSLHDYRDHQGNTLLHGLCRQGKLECVQWLASGLSGHHISLENDNCFTPTALAVKYGRLNCVDWMICETRAKAELHSQDNRWSLLHIATRFGQESCLRWLLRTMQNQDIHLDTLDHHGNSPAHLAARHGHLRCLQALVEFNCDVTMLNAKKHSPCYVATKYNHDTCAQFLVVTETCISLSDDVIQLRKDLREYHQEKELLKIKLEDAVSCSKALAEMHPANVSERLEQIEEQYVDLTDMLVRRIDDMHQQWKKELSDTSTLQQWSDEIVVCKQRASQLQDTCCKLREEDRACRTSQREGEIMRIRETLNKVQPVSDVSMYIGQRSNVKEDCSQPLSTMRERLSEVHLIHPASHSAQDMTLSNKQDGISLSSSYTSLSSSSSSLSLMWNSPFLSAEPSLHKQVSWDDYCQPLAEHVISHVGPEKDEQKDPESRVKRHLNDLISGKSSSATNSNQSMSSHKSQYYRPSKDDGDYATPTNPSSMDEMYSSRLGGIGTIPGDHKHILDRSENVPGNEKQGERVHEASLKIVLPDVINSGDFSRGQEFLCDGRERTGKSDDTPSPSRNAGVHDCSKGNPFLSEFTATSSGSAKHTRQSSVNSLLPSVQMPTPIKNLEDLPRPVVSSRESSVASVPTFMRKIVPSGHQVCSENISQIEQSAEIVASAEEEGDFHGRLNSDSSMSSVSSDVVWSDSDTLDAQGSTPLYKRRAGILNRNRKTGEGQRKSRSRHIKFAPGVDSSPSSHSPDSSLHRRDLSPIYESEAHRQQREQNISRLQSAQSALSPESVQHLHQALLGHREYHINYYSSDEDDYETDSPASQVDSRRNLGAAVDETSNEQGEGLDVIQQDSLRHCNDEAESFWYESSGEEDNTSSEQVWNTSVGSTAEKHICYL